MTLKQEADAMRRVLMRTPDKVDVTFRGDSLNVEVKHYGERPDDFGKAEYDIQPQYSEVLGRPASLVQELLLASRRRSGRQGLRVV